VRADVPAWEQRADGRGSTTPLPHVPRVPTVVIAMTGLTSAGAGDGGDGGDGGDSAEGERGPVRPGGGDRQQAWLELLEELDAAYGRVLPRRVVTSDWPTAAAHSVASARTVPADPSLSGPPTAPVSPLRLPPDVLGRRVPRVVGGLGGKTSRSSGSSGSSGRRLAEGDAAGSAAGPRTASVLTSAGAAPQPSQGVARRQRPAARRHGRHSSLGGLALGLAPADHLFLDLVGRHPFLSAQDLATVLDHTTKSTRRQRAHLLDAGLVRLLGPGEAPEHLVAQELTELTAAGLALVAAHQGLPLGVAVRHTGLTGGGPGLPPGSRLARLRANLLARLEHTRGADGVFVRLAGTGHRRARAGYDEGLDTWWNAQACQLPPSHPTPAGGFEHLSPLRPDGYGEYRRGGRRHGCFVEFDRGTDNRDGYLRKFGAYHECWRSGRYRQHYLGFPTILLITTDTDVENRIATYVRQSDSSRFGRHHRLPLLLTVTWRYAGQPGDDAPVVPPDRLLGPIWRDAYSRARRRWLPERLT
ncbi:MAG: replication-relaxation family protein, partial [Chloroflexota bacterium]